MTITKAVENDKTIIRLAGWLDTQAAPQLKEAVAELGQVKELIFDFDEVEYMASSGLREVVSAYKKQSDDGNAFSVINVNSEIMSIFSMTKVDKKINISAK